MKFFFICVCVMSCQVLNGLVVLPSDYLVSYGSNSAPLQVVEFVSLSCPYCVECYVNDFQKIKSELIDEGKVQWVFHLFPADEVTMSAASCLESLDQQKKRVFLELILESCQKSTPEALLATVQAFADKIGKEIPDPRLESKWKGKDVESFTRFLSTTEVEGTPTVSINGVLRPDLQPSFSSISREVFGYEN